MESTLRVVWLHKAWLIVRLESPKGVPFVGLFPGLFVKEVRLKAMFVLFLFPCALFDLASSSWGLLLKAGVEAVVNYYRGWNMPGLL